MQIRMLRRQYQAFWRTMSRLVPLLIVAELLVLCLLSGAAQAATRVAFVHAEHAPATPMAVVAGPAPPRRTG